jgi:hypothetical protein
VVRFFLGLGFGVTLTVYSFGLGGIGHGTYAPLVFTMPLIALITDGGAIFMIVLAPFLWALYFLLIPRIRTAWIRLAWAFTIFLIHVVTGGWLAIEDPAFTRTVSDDRGGLLIFGFLLAVTMSCLFYFALRGDAIKQLEH